MRTLLVDNHDSFTFNLYHLLTEVNGVAPTVVKNDECTWEEIDIRAFDAIVVSPGPGRPQRADDLGLSLAAITRSDLPLLGVCLGHQALAYLAGGAVTHVEPVHGRTSMIHHRGDDLFSGIPSPFRAVRYHSLAVVDVPHTLEVTAWTTEGDVMAVRDRTGPRWGVQFHPESILTSHGRLLLENFRTQVQGGPRPQPRDHGQARVYRTGAARRPRHRVVVERHDLEVDTAHAFVGLYGVSPTAFWLDSSAHIPGRSRFSFLGDAAGPLAEIVTYDVDRRRVTIRSGGRRHTEPGPLLDWLGSALEARRVTDPGLPFDFTLGFVGYLGYEMKAETVGARAHTSARPDATLVFADRLVVVDHDESAIYLLALDDGTPATNPRSWFEAASARLRRLAGLGPLPEPPEPGPDADVAIRYRHPPDTYLDLVETCKRHIRDGESYEICLTNELRVDLPVDPLRTYLAYRSLSHAPYAAYLRLPGFSVLSASPERFLRVDAEGTVETRPIKGTAPRAADPEEDRRLAEALRTSEKDRAENLMIVDLSRHDLGRVCAVGTVEVPDLFAVESYTTVHQLVSTVRGRLRPDHSAVDAVRAAFPGGSMTGAPKRRTMEIIDRLEGGPRGVYAGALGYFGCTGTADLSIVIRTMVVDPTTVSLGVGGAIVHLSDTEAELREAMLKARAAVDALRVAQVSPTQRHGLVAR